MEQQPPVLEVRRVTKPPALAGVTPTLHIVKARWLGDGRPIASPRSPCPGSGATRRSARSTHEYRFLRGFPAVC